LGETAIIILAFSFFAPAFLFLLPSLRKKAGVFKYTDLALESIKRRNSLKQSLGMAFF